MHSFKKTWRTKIKIIHKGDPWNFLEFIFLWGSITKWQRAWDPKLQLNSHPVMSAFFHHNHLHVASVQITYGSPYL